MSFFRLIRSCVETNSIFKGKSIHARIVISGSNPDIQTINHLLNMYTKLNCIDYAQKLFDEMPVRNLITWTSLISAYSHTGFPEKALAYFRLMVLDDEIIPNDYTYVAAISACAHIPALRTGKEIHGRICRLEENVNEFVNNCLVNFYGKCGSLMYARVVFDAIAEPNTVSCVSLISSCFQCGENEEGLRIFLKSLKIGAKINEFSYVSVLGACAALDDLKLGMEVQCLALKCGVKMDQFVVTGLVNFYAKLGHLEFAHTAFNEAEKPSLTAWTALIGGYVQLGKAKDAIRLFKEFLSTNLKPNELTFASVLGAFSKEKEIQGGLQLHCSIVKTGFEAFTFVSNAVLDFYAKVDRLDGSFTTFYEMGVHDISSWNTLLAGFVNSGRYEEASRIVKNMFLDGFAPDHYTYSTILNFCGDLPAIEWGKQTHCRIIKPGFDSNIVLGSAMIDMYAKCGRLSDAQKVFKILPYKNLISWNSLISGYAQHGFGREALNYYHIMLNNGIKPNDVTFIAVLSSCVHVGSLEEGLNYFDSMTKEYKIIPRTEHLSCVVSLLARKGQTKRAYDFIRNFTFTGEPDKVVWRCLLSGCVSNKDLELAEFAAEKILSIDPYDASVHVMLSNIYADLKMWSEASQVRRIMKEKALKKETGYSWTELKNNLVLFSSGHNMENGVRKVLTGLTDHMYDDGYIPDDQISVVDGE